MPERESELQRLLGGPPPPSVVALGPEVVAELEAAVGEARRRQAEELVHARDNVLGALPWPLRKVVGKVLRA